MKERYRIYQRDGGMFYAKDRRQGNASASQPPTLRRPSEAKAAPIPIAGLADARQEENVHNARDASCHDSDQFIGCIEILQIKGNEGAEDTFKESVREISPEKPQREDEQSAKRIARGHPGLIDFLCCGKGIGIGGLGKGCHKF